MTYRIVSWGGALYCYLNLLLKFQKVMIKVDTKKDSPLTVWSDFFHVSSYECQVTICEWSWERCMKANQSSKGGTRNKHLLLSDKARNALSQWHFSHLALKSYNLLSKNITKKTGTKFKNEMKNGLWTSKGTTWKSE